MKHIIEVSRSDSLRLDLLLKATGKTIPDAGPANITITSEGVSVVFKIVD